LTTYYEFHAELHSSILYSVRRTSDRPFDLSCTYDSKSKELSKHRKRM